MGTAATGSSNFYPRPPREGRHAIAGILAELKEFLSTPSARRATEPLADVETPEHDFYPRPPRGGRPGRTETGGGCSGISIHALHEEGDVPVRTPCLECAHFYPRPP